MKKIEVVNSSSSLSETIFNSIKLEILKGNLKPNQSLSQKEVADNFNVSRIPVREAFVKLESMGFLQKRINSRYYVQAFSVKEIEDLYDTRLILELEGLKMAFPHYSKIDIILYDGMVQQMEHITDSGDYIILNAKFHEMLIEKCPNKQLVAFINQLWDGVALYSPSIVTNQSHFPNHEHKELINAIKRNDLSTALSVYEQHIVNAKKRLLEYIQ